MSGTSLDGLDLVHVQFKEMDHAIEFTILNALTVPYPTDLESSIRRSNHLSIAQIQILNKAIGLFYAEQVNDFISDKNIDKTNIEAIASHGQTILHQPENGFTLQLGCGSTLAYHTGIPVINDFRTLDVVAGGQGAPLVPIGDNKLFSNKADAFINIGGFCNISFDRDDKTHAFDICPGNLPLNKFARQLNTPFDKGGELAKSGGLDSSLLEKLNALSYYSKQGPKSLGTEWLEEIFQSVLPEKTDPKSALRTITEHIAHQISEVLRINRLKSVFITGGGAKNSFLIEELKKKFSGEIIVPDNITIDFKESLIFAFLGYCYLSNLTTTIKSVTGADAALCTGVYHKPGYPTLPHR